MNGNAKHRQDGAADHVNEQQMMDYLEGRLSPEQAHDMEKMMADSGFLDDAVEGLSQMKDRQQLPGIVQELNQRLHAKVGKQRTRHRQYLPDAQTITIIALVTILVLVTLTYIIFRMYQN